MTELEKQNRDELFRLMRENPELPVVPLVSGEIAGDCCGYWVGCWGSANIDEYLLPEGCESVVYKSDDDVFDVLEKCLPDDEFDKLPETESECRKVYDSLPWIKAIFVCINAEG